MRLYVGHEIGGTVKLIARCDDRKLLRQVARSIVQRRDRESRLLRMVLGQGQKRKAEGAKA